MPTGQNPVQSTTKAAKYYKSLSLLFLLPSLQRERLVASPVTTELPREIINVPHLLSGNKEMNWYSLKVRSVRVLFVVMGLAFPLCRCLPTDSSCRVEIKR